MWEIWSSKSKLSFTIKLEYNRFRFQEWTVPFSNETFCLVKTSFLAPVILGKKWMWNSFFPQMKHFVLWRSQGWNLNPKFTNYMKGCCMSCFLEIPVGGTILRNNFQDWLKLLVQYEVSSSRLNFWFTVKNEYCLCYRSSIFGFKWQVLPVVALFSPFTSFLHTESGAAVCEYFMRNVCNRGPLCPFRHTKGEKTVVCKHWLRGLCKKGDQCEFLHEYDMTKMPECYFYSKFGELSVAFRGT